MMITHHHHLPPYIWTKRLKPGGPPDKPQQEQLFIKQGQHTAFPCARLHPKAKWRPLKRIPPQDNALVRLCGGPSSTPHHSRRPFQAQEQLLKNHHALANGRQMIKSFITSRLWGSMTTASLSKAARPASICWAHQRIPAGQLWLLSPHVWSIHSQNVGCPLNRFRRLADDQLSAFQKQSAELEPARGRPAPQEKAGLSPLSAPALFRRDFFLLIAQQNPPEDAKAAHQGSAPPRLQISGRKVHRMEESNGSFHPFGTAQANGTKRQANKT